MSPRISREASRLAKFPHSVKTNFLFRTLCSNANNNQSFECGPCIPRGFLFPSGVTSRQVVPAQRTSNPFDFMRAIFPELSSCPYKGHRWPCMAHGAVVPFENNAWSSNALSNMSLMVSNRTRSSHGSVSSVEAALSIIVLKTSGTCALWPKHEWTLCILI